MTGPLQGLSADARARYVRASAALAAGRLADAEALVRDLAAAHPRVEAPGELRDLPQVLAEESRRRGCACPKWVAALDAGNWQHLGERWRGRWPEWRVADAAIESRFRISPTPWVHPE